MALTAGLAAAAPVDAQSRGGRDGFARGLEQAFESAAVGTDSRRPAAPTPSRGPSSTWWAAPGHAAVRADVVAEMQARLNRTEETELYDFYAARRWRPMWVEAGLRPEAAALLAQIMTADADGLDPADYGLERLRRTLAETASGGAATLADAELALSRTLAAYTLDLRRGRGVSLAFVDPELARAPPTTRSVLEAAASAPSLRGHIETLPHLNPVYMALRRALADYRAVGRVSLAAASGPSAANRDYEQLLRINLERARILPPVRGKRYLLVNTAAARLWLIEDGRVVDTMKVVVGRREQPTPMMAGLLRYAIYNPYWNVPEDLTRTSIAAKVLKQGLRYLQREQMEVLADFSDDARRLDPAEVDWSAVASGARQVRVRQTPGERNMMGEVKLMLPNPLGVYLHDTPNKAAFDLQERLLSSGCVRLEDALRLASHLISDPPRGLGRDDGERPVSLAEPVPVYITYLTLAPEPDGLVLHPDIYRRDKALLAVLNRPESEAGASRRAVALAAGAAVAEAGQVP